MSVPMSTTPVSHLSATSPTRDHNRLGVAACLAGSALAIAAPVVTGGLGLGEGPALTEELVAASVRLQIGASLAAIGAAALLVAAARLARAVPGVAGTVTGSAGAAVAVLLAAFYASFASGAVVAGLLLQEPSGAVGEGTLLLINLVELTRYAPGLALLVAAVVARHALPKPVYIAAGLLAVLTLVPFTTWVVALAVPVWLGLAGAFVRQPAA